MSRLSFDWHVSRTVADAHKGVVLTHAANQRKVEESRTKTKDPRLSWWPLWQEPFASCLEVPREGRGRGTVNRRASEARTSLVSCIPSFPPPPTVLLYNLCRRGFYFCVCIFFICVCTLFVWWDKDRKGEALGLGTLDKTSLQLGASAGLWRLVQFPATIRDLPFTMPWGKVCRY